MVSSFDRYLFDERKLRDRALLQLARALRDDRMVAIVGTMATEARGYGDWKTFTRKVGDLAVELRAELPLAARESAAGAAIEFHAGRLRTADECAVTMPYPVEVGLLREAFDAIDRDVRSRWPPQRPTGDGAPAKSWRARFDDCIAGLFLTPPLVSKKHDGPTCSGVIRGLVDGLGIRRFATLNYDLEIERALMLPPAELIALQHREANLSDEARMTPAKHPFHRLCGPPGPRSTIVREDTRRLRRRMADGTVILSDILDRERPDHLFEFAIGSSEVDYHILHLHGRADDPRSMTVDIADYDLLYRLDDVHSNAFQHGLRTLFSGNPILFVGLGMTEAELNAFFQYMVSNSPYRRSAPAFLLWNTLDEKRYCENPSWNGRHAMRVDYLRRLGIHVIFDDDLGGRSEARMYGGDEGRPAYSDLVKRLRTRYGTVQANAEAQKEAARAKTASAAASGAVGTAADASLPADTDQAAPAQVDGTIAAAPSDPGTPVAGTIADRPATGSQDMLGVAPVPPPPAADAAENAIDQEIDEAIERMRLAQDQEDRAIPLVAIEQLVRHLPPVVRWHWRSADRTIERGDDPGGRGTTWRSLAAKIDDVGGQFLRGKPMRLWGAEGLAEHARQWLAEPGHDFETLIDSASPALRDMSPLLIGVAGAGSGRGMLAEAVLQRSQTTSYALSANEGPSAWIIRGTQPVDRLLINAGFGYDSDSILGALDLFLRKRRMPGVEGEPDDVGRRMPGGSGDAVSPGRSDSRERRFYTGELFGNSSPALVIVNGIDRFFAFDGSLLSAEFDQLFRSILKYGTGATVQWLLLGTARIESYFRTLGLDVHNVDALRIARAQAAAGEFGDHARKLRSRYLASIVSAVKEAGPDPAFLTRSDAADGRLANAQRVDRSGIPRAFFAAVLDPRQLRAWPLVPPVPAAIAAANANSSSRPPLAPAPAQDRPVRDDGTSSAADPAPAASADTRKARFDRYLHPDVVAAILRTMSFIGEPIPCCVLLHAPAVLAAMRGVIDSAHRASIVMGTIGALVARNLILRIEPFDSGSPRGKAEGENAAVALPALEAMDRIGLHRSLATELRNQLGVPLGASKLSTSFNMSLFVAQPTDNSNPDPLLHQELGELVDHLIGAPRDLTCKPDPNDPRGAKLTIPGSDTGGSASVPYPRDISTVEDVLSHCHDHAVPCLRAALSVVRGYYSTTNLLTFDPRSPPGPQGALTEHTERLDRLLKGYGKVTDARRIVRATGDTVPGPEPFYADDLVWLHNERGVAKLAQGDLYDARRSLSLAAEANRLHLEGAYPGHNWRRITLNLVSLYIERGRLSDAERLIDEVESTIDRTVWSSDADESGAAAAGVARKRRTDRIIAEFGTQTDDVQNFTSALYTREEIMTVGITTGYRGLIAFLRGRLKDARERYSHGITILRRIGEQRAYALFQRHYATVHRSPDEIMRQVALAIKASGSIHQDIAYRAKVLRAAFVRRMPDAAQTVRHQALRDMHDALRYAAATDAYRVRIEASTALAREMRRSGDYDTALQYAADGVAIASRYGHVIHKLALRIEIGRILVQRGDPKSGRALLDRAVLTATKYGFAQIAEYGQRRDWDHAEHPLPNDLAED